MTIEMTGLRVPVMTIEIIGPDYEHKAEDVQRALERAKVREFEGDVRVAFTRALNDRLILATEVERLQAAVDKLPKTADGVPVVPGMRLWETPGDWFAVRLSMTAGPYCKTFPKWDEVYSTREAADAKEE